MKRRRTRTVPSESHEASLRRAISTFFRVAQLDSPEYFLTVLAMNKLFKVTHDGLYFGWIAFAHLQLRSRKTTTIPNYLPHLAPYLTQASFYIERYVRNLSAFFRERLRNVLMEVNVIMRRQVFSEATFYGVESHQMTKEIERNHKASLASAKRVKSPLVRGKCLRDQEHGPFVETCSGVVCTTCGRVGRRQYFQNFEDKQTSKSKLQHMSLASQRFLPQGAMDSLVKVSDPLRSMTRAQFIGWTERPLFVPEVEYGNPPNSMNESSIRSQTFSLPAEYRHWMLYLYDFIKDQKIEKNSREERISHSWANAIWIYGYMVWVVVHRDTTTAQREEDVVQTLQRSDAQGSVECFDPTRVKFRYLEAHAVVSNVEYFRVLGSEYRFYPPKMLPLRFQKDVESNTVFADQHVRSLVQLSASNALKEGKRVQFWENRYVVRRSKRNSNMLCVRATRSSDECYFHIIVPKKIPIRFFEVQHCQHVFRVQPWNDPYLVKRYPQASHFFVHFSPFRQSSGASKLRYIIGTGEESEIEIFGLSKTMKRRTWTLGKANIPLVIQPARITLNRVSKEYRYIDMPC